MKNIILSSIVICSSFLLSGCTNKSELPNTKNIVGQNNKTEKMAIEITKEYWEATKFKDYGLRYKYICEDIKNSVSKEKYIKKYKEDEEERPLAQINNYQIGEARIEEDRAFVRVTLFGLIDKEEGQSDTTELRFENGDWCKDLSNETKEWLLN